MRRVKGYLPFPFVRHSCDGGEGFQIAVGQNVECDLGRKRAEDINTHGSLSKAPKHASSCALAFHEKYYTQNGKLPCLKIGPN